MLSGSLAAPFHLDVAFCSCDPFVLCSVQAHNAEGSGEWSGPTSITLGAAVPGAPPPPRGTGSDARSIAVEWDSAAVSRTDLCCNPHSC